MDAHFAVSMRQVNSYVNELACNVVTPGDLVAALGHRGGLANSSAELIYIVRSHEGLVDWKAATMDGRIQRFGRINEFRYKQEAVSYTHLTLPTKA